MSASGSVPGGARNPIGRPGTNGSPTGCPGPVAFWAAARMPLAKVALKTPTGLVSARGGLTAFARVRPLGAIAYTRSVHGITGAAAARLSGVPVGRSPRDQPAVGEHGAVAQRGELE